MSRHLFIKSSVFLALVGNFCGDLQAEKVPLKFESNSLRKNYKELISHAHKLYEEGAFVEALDQFEQASRLRQKISPSLRYRMALLYHLLNDEKKVIELLQSKSTFKKIPETHFLIALSYKELDQFPAAERHLRHYLDLPNPKHRDEALLELAEVLFLQDKMTKSYALLEPLTRKNHEERVLLALSKTLIWMGNFKQAEQILRENVFKGENFALYAYLMGEIAANRGNYPLAIEYFQEAHNTASQKQVRWHSRLFESEARAHLILADDWSLPPKSRLHHLMEARTPLKKLGFKEQLIAHYAISAANLLGDHAPRAQISQLLDQQEEDDPQVLYLQAQLAKTHQEKEEIYKKLTSGKLENPYVLRGWYMRGQNDLTLGKETHDPQVLNRACFAFEQVWQYCQDQNPQLASRALQAQLETYLVENSRKSLKQALQLIDKVPASDYGTFYLQGLVFYNYSQLQDQEYYSLKAKEAWEKVLDETPYYDYALFGLGVFYFQSGEWAEAEKKFLELQVRAPRHTLIPEALTYAAKSQEMLGRDPTDTRVQIFESYPHSPFAAEAFLNLYTQQDYVKGHSEALDHLKKFPKRFPQSEWGIEAYYLLGLDAKRDHHTSSGNLHRPKNLPIAARYFQRASDLFQSLKIEHNHDYFAALNAQATIERALVNLDISDTAEGTKKQIYLEYVVDLLKGLVDNPSFGEECQFNLATTYEKMGDDAKAEEIYHKMQKKYQESKVTRGYYLAKTYYQLGMIHKRHLQTDKALRYFELAEDAAKGNILSSDQYLDILIQQSLCHQVQKEDDLAMMILSRVINEDVASSQRLKAMFLRSHIYHEQGRDELAIRQLEALAKQQGEWAVKAKEELQAYEY